MNRRMKQTGWLAGLILSCNLATAQVGTWQVTLKRAAGFKETGFAYVTINPNGTSSGYALTTDTFGVATYSGMWTSDGQGNISSSFTEELRGQQFSGALQAKFTATSIRGAAVINGVLYKFKGKPALPVPDFSGNWYGTVTQRGFTAVENFTGTQNQDFPGIFD